MAQLREKWREPFGWLADSWTDNSPWSAWQDAFVEQLGLSDASDDREVVALFERIDKELSDGNRKQTLVDETARAQFAPELYQSDDYQEPYWDGQQWLRWHADPGEWRPMAEDDTLEAARDNTKVEPYWDGEKWLRWNDTAGEWQAITDELC